VAGLLLAEGTARLMGFEPFTYAAPPPWAPRMFAFDSELGWVNKPGTYKIDYMPDKSYPVKITIGPDGSRSSPDRQTLPISKWIYFFGGSVGFGWAVSDGENFSDIVAAETEFASVNLGAGGYGTLQNLLKLNRVAQEWDSERKPAAIIYAFATHHSKRSIGDPDWMRNTEKNRGSWSAVWGIPYTRLNDLGELEIHPATSFFRWPLREYSALITLAEKAFVDFTWGISQHEREQIVSKLFIRFRDIARSKGVPVYVVSIMMQP